MNQNETNRMDNRVTIRSLSEYLKFIEDVVSSKEISSVPMLYYRGEADATWEKKAALFRGKSEDTFNLKDANWSIEKDLINSALTVYPDAFGKCPNAISRLVKMQHYFLPTRLYDVTSNPLIALYFACSGEFGKDGMVLFTKSDVRLTSLDDVTILADLAELLDVSDKSVKNMFDYLRVYDRIPAASNEQSLERFLFKYVTESLLFQPPMDNERIKRQQGALIFSALMKPFDNENEYQIMKQELESTNVISEKMKELPFSKCHEVDLRTMFDDNCFYINKDDKVRILQELDSIGINEGFVYPDLEHQMKTIKFKNLPKNNFEYDLNKVY